MRSERSAVVIIGGCFFVGSCATGISIGMDTFGASAPLKELQRKFGFTPDRVMAAVREQLLTDRLREKPIHQTSAGGEV